RPARVSLARRDSGLTFLSRFLARFSPPPDFFPLQLGRRSVEDEHRTNVVVGKESRGPKDEAVQMGCNPAFRILERLAISGAHDREELVQLAVFVHRGRWRARRLSPARMPVDDRGAGVA